MSNSNKIIIFLIFSSSLFAGFIFGEDSTGGAKMDFINLSQYMTKFNQSFLEGINYFTRKTGSIVHSPIFYILVGNLLKIFNDIIFINIIYIIISCVLPFTFYKILKLKNLNIDIIIFLLALIIFISPYFRASAIWLLGDNLSLIFFSFSIYFFLKTQLNNQKISNYYFCLIFLILCCYIRYYYCLFAIFYLFNFKDKMSFKNFVYLLSVCAFLSLPALIYLKFIIFEKDFFTKLSGPYLKLNYLSNSLVILSIFAFYLFPFIIFKISKIYYYYKINFKYFLIITMPIIIIFFIDYFLYQNLITQTRFGGGVFSKSSNLFNLPYELIIVIFCIVSLLIFDFLFKEKRFYNYSLILTLCLSFPMHSIYQKYFDPLFYLLIFGLVKSENILENFNLKNIAFLYFYFGTFFIFSTYYYSVLN